jgi:hypothetical protein
VTGLQRMMATTGEPLTVTSDNGSAFISKRFTDFLHSNGITFTPVSAHHQSANGVNERRNAQIYAIIASEQQRFGGEWDLHMQTVNFLLNATYSAAIKTYSDRVLLGKEVLWPDEAPYMVDILSQRLDSPDEIRSSAAAAINEQGRRYVELHRKRTLPPYEFTAGQHVLVRWDRGRKGNRDKFEPTYCPATVVESTELHLYVKDDVSKWRVRRGDAIPDPEPNEPDEDLASQTPLNGPRALTEDYEILAEEGNVWNSSSE